MVYKMQPILYLSSPAPIPFPPSATSLLCNHSEQKRKSLQEFFLTFPHSTLDLSGLQEPLRATPFQHFRGSTLNTKITTDGQTRVATQRRKHH